MDQQATMVTMLMDVFHIQYGYNQVPNAYLHTRLATIQ